VKRANSPEPARGFSSEFVSGNYFTMFGLNPAAGRLLVPADEDFAASPVAVISHRLWQQRYSSDPRVIGSVFNFNDKPLTIVGVAPSGFFGDTMSQAPPDFFLPLTTEPLIKGDSTLLRAPDRSWLELIGRVRPGTNLQSLEAEMRVQLQQWLRSHWGEMDENSRINLPKQTLYLGPGGAGITVMRERYERWLQILMMISGLVLLIVCANVASLMLVRAIARRQQVALSNALGASTSRLVRSALTESFLLALIGGAAGLVISVISTKLILRFAFAHIDGFGYVPISSSPSLPILLFAFAVSLLTGIIFGIAPAWMAAKANPIEALRGASRSTGGTGSMPRRVLVVLQAALALVLLSVAGLLTATLHNLENQDLGFEQDGRAVVNLDPNLAGYRADQLTNLYLRVRDAMLAIPGVESVAIATYAPQSGDSWTDTMYIDGRPAPRPQDDNAASFDRISPDYFEVVGNPIVKGRAFTEQDNRQSHNVAIVNEAFARKFFRDENPIGKYFGRMEIGASRLYEVVGVAKDSRILTYNLDQPVGPFFFIPQEQYDTFSTPELTQSDVRTHYAHDIIIKTKPGIKLAAADIQRAMESVDSTMPIIFIVSMREQVANQYTQQRLIARLTSSLGLVALLLACIGMYGVTAYNSNQRVNEIGVRMALGANQANVIALILRGALLLITSGLVIGIPLTVAAGYVLGSQLFGMKPYSVGITALAVLAVGLSAFVAALVPAFRASRISPLEALRTE
jgi:predicted permease